MTKPLMASRFAPRIRQTFFDNLKRPVLRSCPHRLRRVRRRRPRHLRSCFYRTHTSFFSGTKSRTEETSIRCSSLTPASAFTPAFLEAMRGTVTIGAAPSRGRCKGGNRKEHRIRRLIYCRNCQAALELSPSFRPVAGGRQDLVDTSAKTHLCDRFSALRISQRASQSSCALQRGCG